MLSVRLLPCTPTDSLIVIDNAAVHKRLDIVQAIKDAGFLLEYLPAYSLDLNPIEHKWAQAKACRRKWRCDVGTLFSDHLY